MMVASQLRGRGIRDQRVLDAMARVPRHEFVADEYREQAYEDHPIPIAEGQTVSQPYIVAVTLDALSLQPSFKVLEIGTGSGYQTALLAELCSHVYSVERHTALARNAEATLAQLGYNNVSVIVGDGSQGLPAMAPFDAIVVSAAAPQIPESKDEPLRIFPRPHGDSRGSRPSPGIAVGVEAGRKTYGPEFGRLPICAAHWRSGILFIFVVTDNPD